MAIKDRMEAENSNIIFLDNNNVLKFEYCKDGIAVSDFALDSFMADILQNQEDTYYKFSTENIFNRIQLAIVEQRLNYENIFFVFNGEELSINKNGQCSSWPTGFLSECSRTARNILRTRIESKREQRKEQRDAVV